jgi:hypothetical protein
MAIALAAVVRPLPAQAPLPAQQDVAPAQAGIQGPDIQGELANRNAAELTVLLVTMGQGDLVWEKFGHNGIWIHDPIAGTDLFYNYGVFDFNSPGYWGRFIRGNWIYQLSVSDINQTLAAYHYHNRTVTAQELNLTPGQKAALRDFLEWNARPENREYGYDYYRDNCSTRARDALDAALGGQIAEQTIGEGTGTTYRWHSRRLMVGDPLSYTGLAVGLGPAADRPITVWEEMFLPGSLQEHLRSIEVRGANGALEPLVMSERVLYEAVDRASEREAPPFPLPWYLLIGVALAAAFVVLGGLTPANGIARLSFSAIAALWSVMAGVGGLMLAGLWALTDHTIAHRNENLFQFDPLALGLVMLVPALAYGARWAARPARILALIVAGIACLGFVLQVLPWFDQVNGEVIALMLPAHLGLAWSVHRLARRIAQARND